MSRLTITISDLHYRALKEASAQRNKTIGQLIEESLEFYNRYRGPASGIPAVPAITGRNGR